MNEKKGFTLIELLITIAILSFAFLGGYILIKGVIDNSKTVMSEATKKMIIGAAENYALEFRESEKWQEEIVNGDSYFCISLESLINYGYFNKDKIAQYVDKYLVKMTLINGIYEYEVIEKELANNVCKYYKRETEITENSSGNYDISENDTNVGSIKYTMTKVKDNTYNMNLNFGIDFKIEEIVTTIPTYVAIVLDNSGTMKNQNKYTKAVSAASNFSKIILENVSDAKIALVKYDQTAKIINGYENKKYEENDFGECSSYVTNTSGGLDAVSALIYNGKNNVNNYTAIEDNSNIYTVLLYDGIPNRYYQINNITTIDIDTEKEKKDYFSNFITNINNNATSCDKKCVESVEASSRILKNDFNSKLIVIGYEMDNVDSRLKTIATKDNVFCKNSDYSDYCYYDSDSSNITDLFANISSTIIENVKSTDVKKAKIILTPVVIDGESAFIIKKDDIIQDSIEESLDLSNHKESIKLEINGNYELTLNEKIFKGCKADECTKNIKLFNTQIILEYEDKENKVIEIENVPKVTITSTEVITVN